MDKYTILNMSMCVYYHGFIRKPHLENVENTSSIVDKKIIELFTAEYIYDNMY